VSVVVLISACVPSICYSGVKNCVLSEQQLKSLVVCYDDIAITFAFSQNGHQRTDWLGRACVCECQSTAYQAIKERMGGLHSA
jgi:hypothetical protein